MRACKSILIQFFAASLIIFTACNSDDDGGGEKLKGQLGITTVTTGTIADGHKYLITFSDLVGDLEYKDGVEIGANDNMVLEMNRVGEILSVYISNVPTDCPDISSASSTSNQIATNQNPNDSKHPEAQYESKFLIPLNGSVGELTFTIACN